MYHHYYYNNSSDDSDFWLMMIVLVAAMLVTTMILVAAPSSAAADCQAASPSQYQLELDFDPERLCRRNLLDGRAKRAERLNAYFQKALSPELPVQPGRCQTSGERYLGTYPTTIAAGIDPEAIMTKICSRERIRRDKYLPFITAIFRAYHSSVKEPPAHAPADQPSP